MKLKKLVPAHDRILIKLIEAESETEGGIMIPQESQDVPNVGTVISMGAESKKMLPDVTEGDMIMIMKFGGLPVEVNETDMRLISYNDVLGTVVV